MSERNGRIGQQNGTPGSEQQSDVFCRSVIAAAAAMLALKLCEYLRKVIQGRMV